MKLFLLITCCVLFSCIDFSFNVFMFSISLVTMSPCLYESFCGLFHFNSLTLLFTTLNLLVALIYFVSFFSSNAFGSHKKLSMMTLSLMLYTIFAGFMTTSYLIFYTCLELIFIVMFFLLMKSGVKMKRKISSFYMFFFTLVTSLPLLMFMVISVGFLKFHLLGLSLSWSGLWWAFSLVVFLVKVPLYGVHMWLPKAHVEAPLLGSIFLSGILLKIGFYGIFRFLSLCKLLMKPWLGVFISVAWCGAILISFFCIRQVDVKSMVAYSSVVHMGVALSSGLISQHTSVKGSIFMSVAHGLSSPMMFYSVYMLYNLSNTRSVLLTKGASVESPLMSLVVFLVMVSALGIPPFMSFFSEVLSNLSLVSLNQLFISLSLVLLMSSGVYMVYFFSFFSHGVNFLHAQHQITSPDLILTTFLFVSLIMLTALI